MSLISKLTYQTKTNPIAITDRTKQATAEDFNEIKTVVNNCVDGINWIKSDEIHIPSGTTTVLFLNAYPSGVPYGIIVHNCFNTKGYNVAHRISNKTVLGFDVTVSEASTFTYLAVPKR